MPTSRATTAELLQRLSIAELNPMQREAHRAIGTGADVVLVAPTGSGKTLAFLLPLAERLDPGAEGVQALVLVPARELALQIEEVWKRLGTGLRATCCYGGHDVRIEARNLARPPALLVGTPGRVLDHLEGGRLVVAGVRTLVLDEFDKSLELGFHEPMAAILGALPALEQRILTSATDLAELPKFAGVRSPVRLAFTGGAAAEERLRVVQVRASEPDKLDTFFKLVCKLGAGSTLVFLNHRESVERASAALAERGVVNAAFHGGLDQDVRERTLAKFRNGSARILVTTDLASRGLDIPAVQAIVHYHLPSTLEAYVHRNGRTARMTASGSAYVIVGPDERVPAFVEDELPIERLPARAVLPPPPDWTTLYFGQGKKDKLNKVDLVGFLLQKGGLAMEDLGRIEVKDHHAFAAVRRTRVAELMRRVRDERIKGRRVKLELAQ